MVGNHEGRESDQRYVHNFDLTCDFHNVDLNGNGFDQSHFVQK